MARQSEDKGVGDDFRATVRLSDAPAFMAFGVLLVFSWVYQRTNHPTGDSHGFDPSFRAFIGGAVAFQMVVSNWVLAFIFRKPGEPPGAAGIK